MQYEIEINGRLRQVHIHRVDGRFVVAVDAKEWTVDAARVDRQTLSLLIEEVRLKPETTYRGDEVRLKPDTTYRTQSHEVTFAPDPATGGLIVRVGDIPLAVAINGRRRWGRKEEGPQAGSGPQHIIAPMPGRVVRVLVKMGEAVHARQPVVVIEAMKMENELRAVGDGIMAEIHVQDGQSVEAGALLAVIHR